MQDLFHMSVPAWNLVLRAVTVFLSLVFMLRIAGKRQVAQLGMGDFVALMLISNAVQNSMNGGDNSLVGGLIIAAVLIALSFLLQFATFRSKRVERIVQGGPTLLIHRGSIVEANLKRELLSIRELHAMLRRQGVHSMDEVAEAVLESDGYISLVRKGEPIPTGVRDDIFQETSGPKA